MSVGVQIDLSALLQQVIIDWLNEGSSGDARGPALWYLVVTM
jgi:hypothetical protein